MTPKENFAGIKMGFAVTFTVFFQNEDLVYVISYTRN